MKKQLLHEAHNRQDKALKTHYREDMLLQSPDKASIASHARLQHRLASDRYFLPLKKQLLLAYQDGLFVLGEFSFRFSWNLKAFIQHNTVKDHFNRTYKQHKRLAAFDLAAIEKAITTATPTWGISKDARQQIQIPMRLLSLNCDRIIPSDPKNDELACPILIKGIRAYPQEYW